MSEMMYGQIMVHSNKTSDIGKTVTFTDETSATLTGTIGSDGYCRKKLAAFKNYFVTFGTFITDSIALGCGENHFIEVGPIKQSLTIYSAKADTLSYTDVYGNTQTIVFPSDSGSKSVEIEIDPEGSSITFTSSIAKDIVGLTDYYSKTVSITTETTDVYVMPDKVIYWYGFNFENNLTDYAAAGYTYSGMDFSTLPSYNTNSIYIPAPASKGCGVGIMNPISNVSKIHFIGSGISNGSYIPLIECFRNTKDRDMTKRLGYIIMSDHSTSYHAQQILNENLEQGEPPVANNVYLHAISYYSSSATIEAIWYE